MATDRTDYRIEPLETRTHLAANSGAIAGPNGAGFNNVQKYIPTATGYITAGLFSGSVNFGTTSSKNVLTAKGDTDIYVASYGNAGALNWVKQYGGDFSDKMLEQFKRRDILTNPKRIVGFIGKVGEQPMRAGEYLNDMVVDSAGNVIIAGAFLRTIQGNGKTFTSDGSIDKNAYDGFVFKLNNAGNLAWSRTFGGPFSDVASSLALDSSNNVFVGGYYTRQADFDSTSRTLLISTEGRDAGFVMRLAATGGDINWLYQFSSESAERDVRNAVNDIAVTARGEVYFGGTYSDRVDFDPSKKIFNLEAVDKTDAVLGKLNRKGALVWAESTGGDGYDGNSAVALSTTGDLYTAGYFSDEADVDPRPKISKIFTATPEAGDDDPEFSDILVSKFLLDGSPVWQYQMGGSNIELIGDLKVGADNTVHIGGSFFGTFNFAASSSFALVSAKTNDGSIKDANTRFGREDSYDWFYARLTPRGKFVSGANFGGADDDYLSSITVTSSRVYLAGRIVSAPATLDHDSRHESAWVLFNSITA